MMKGRQEIVGWEKDGSSSEGRERYQRGRPGQKEGEAAYIGNYPGCYGRARCSVEVSRSVEYHANETISPRPQQIILLRLVRKGNILRQRSRQGLDGCGNLSQPAHCCTIITQNVVALQRQITAPRAPSLATHDATRSPELPIWQRSSHSEPMSPWSR